MIVTTSLIGVTSLNTSLTFVVTSSLLEKLETQFFFTTVRYGFFTKIQMAGKWSFFHCQTSISMCFNFTHRKLDIANRTTHLCLLYRCCGVFDELVQGEVFSPLLVLFVERDDVVFEHMPLMSLSLFKLEQRCF